MIYVGEMNETFIDKIGSEIQANFPNLLKNGLIEIISPPKNYFPNFDEAKTVNSFGDSPDRIKWRQKQNLGRTSNSSLKSFHFSSQIQNSLMIFKILYTYG